MSVLHPTRRIDFATTLPRCDKSNRGSHQHSPMRRTSGTLQCMTKHEPDPMLDLIAAQFTRHDVAKSGKQYAILDRRTADTIARLRPIPDTDRFELFCQTARAAGRRSATSGA